MSGLPEGWLNNITLEDVSKIVGGATPSSKNTDFFCAPGEGIPWLTPADLSKYQNMYISNGKRDLTQEGYNSCSAKILPKGSVLFSSRAPIGYVVIANDDISTNQGFKSFEIPDLIDSRYLYYYLKHIKSLAELRATGTTFKELSGKATAALPFILAPLNEQIRIANKLDSLLAKVNQAQTRLKKIPILLKRFRQSVLAAATSGELTREWRENKKALKPVDIKGLSKLKNKLIIEKLVKKDLNLIIKDELEVPNSWAVVNLAGLSSKITDGEHKTPKRETEGRLLLSARNVINGQLKLNKVDYVGEEEFNKLRKRCNPDLGDILISCSGSVGRVALCDKSDEYVMVRSAALVKTNLMKQHNKYLMYVLQSPTLQEIIIEKSRSTAQANLFLAPIKELPIPLPPPEEQKEIINRVESLFSLAVKIEGKYQQAKQRLDKLTQSILTKAFRGELVPQDPNDEPAEVLLKRIQAERATAKPAKKIKKKKA